MCDKKIGIITYHYNHLKTQQVFEHLIKKYDKEIFKFYGLPFHPYPAREVAFSHRPDQGTGMPTLQLADQYGIAYKICANDRDIDNECGLYIILGAGILSEEFVSGKKVLNCHPGIIPISRGLDAFKWAIYHLDPVGNSLHYIDKEVDAGEVIAVLPTPVYAHDTLETFADRHYQNEIKIMAEFEKYIKNPVNDFKDSKAGEPHRRMNIETEKHLAQLFEKYKEKHILPENGGGQKCLDFIKRHVIKKARGFSEHVADVFRIIQQYAGRCGGLCR